MSQSIEHILVPTDGSAAALRAAELAGTLARGVGAKVTVALIHPEEIVPALAWNASLPVDEVKANYEQEFAGKALEDTQQALGELPQPPELHQFWGHAADSICRLAEEAHVDLIVMGSRGRSAVGRVLLGSVSQAVMLHAPCAVTVAR
jgi:nucleotide-binding universal stress UspA family protein